MMGVKTIQRWSFIVALVGSVFLWIFLGFTIELFSVNSSFFFKDYSMLLWNLWCLSDRLYLFIFALIVIGNISLTDHICHICNICWCQSGFKHPVRHPDQKVSAGFKGSENMRLLAKKKSMNSERQQGHSGEGQCVMNSFFDIKSQTFQFLS